MQPKVREWMGRANQDEVVLQVDFKNAFGSVFREQMLKEVKARCPLLLPYAAACYRYPNYLFGDGFDLSSSRGVQQGDVCGPALFALAPLILRLGEIPLLLNVWYLDDGVLCGKAEDIKKALELLQNYCAEIDLELNLAKCKLFDPAVYIFCL